MDSTLTKENDSSKKVEEEVVYRSAKLWELLLWMLPSGFFWSFLLAFVSFYAIGIAGLGTVIVSAAITGTRILDGITDPIGGFIFDKTKGKFGKVRLFMAFGYTVMTICLLLIFFTTHHLPEGFRLIYFVLLYCIYVIGNTFSSTAFQAGNAVLTNDPKQRPIQGILMMSYLSIIMAIVNWWLARVLMGRHGGFGTAAVFREMSLTLLGFGVVVAILQIIAISRTDKPENFGTGKVEKIGLRDMISTIKENKPLRIFVIASVTDRLAINISSHQVLNIMLTGIIIGHFQLGAELAIPFLIPQLILVLAGMKLGRKLGTKKAYITAIKLAIPLNILMILFFWFVDPTQIRVGMSGVFIAYFVLHLLSNVSRTWTNAFTSPLLPDIIDYETYRTGKFKPGIIASVNTFIEKFIAAFYQTVVGLVLAAIGFTHAMPDLDTPSTTSIFWATMFLMYGVVIISWIISLIAMKFYELDKERMADIQAELRRRSNEAEAM